MVKIDPLGRHAWTVPVSDAAPQLVSLDEAEVDRLGEGSVQIEARQTDAVGNVHEGGPATSSFVIDTIDPEVDTDC